MLALLGVSSVIGFLVCVVLLVKAKVKKNGKVKKWGIGTGICFVIFVIALILTPGLTPEQIAQAKTADELKVKQAAEIVEKTKADAIVADAKAKVDAELKAKQDAAAKVKADTEAKVSTPLPKAKVYTADEIKTELKRILVAGENKDKAIVAYKIRDVKQVGENEFTIMIYSDLGDTTNFSGNTYQILEYINSELTQKNNVHFFEISVQYFKKINGESIRAYTYQMPKESIKAILDYGSREGSPLTDIKKSDGVTKEKDLDKL